MDGKQLGCQTVGSLLTALCFVRNIALLCDTHPILRLEFRYQNMYAFTLRRVLYWRVSIVYYFVVNVVQYLFRMEANNFNKTIISEYIYTQQVPLQFEPARSN